MMPVPVTREASVADAEGIHPDHWCEPTCFIRMTSRQDAGVATAEVWINPEATGPHKARLALQVDRDEPFVCDVARDRRTYVGFPVRRSAGQSFVLRLSCDSRVANKGSDKRNLSFVLNVLTLDPNERVAPLDDACDSARFGEFAWTNEATLQGQILGVAKGTRVQALMYGKQVADVRTDERGVFHLPVSDEVAGHCARTLRVVCGESSVEIDLVLDPHLVGMARAQLSLPLSEVAPAHAGADTMEARQVSAAMSPELVGPLVQALTVQTQALQALLYRSPSGAEPEPAPALVPAPRLSPSERYGALLNAAVNLPARERDIIWLGVIDWDFRIQRPQHIAANLARRGCRVFYVSIVFAPLDDRGRFEILRAPEPGVFEIRLKLGSELPPNIYRRFEPEVVSQILAALDEMTTVLSVREPAVVVQYPSWTPVAFGIPGATVVHDCLDLVSGFDNTPTEIIALEHELVTSADVVVTTSKPLHDLIAKERPTTLIRNGAEIGFFARASHPAEVRPYDGKVIGYFGAIAHWFETAWIAKAAKLRPDWTFVLIGSTDGADVSRISRLPNVVLLGEKPYAELVDHLAYFDVGIIPFKLLDLIQCTNPVKLYEYMAAGKPVVASAMPEVIGAADTYIARNAKDFVSKIELAIEEDCDQLRRARMKWASAHSWEKRAEAFCELLHSSAPKVSVIVLSYKNWDLTQAALWSLLAFSDYENLEIIVVDNGSGDEVVNNLRTFAQRDPRIKLVLSERNLGYAAGNNLGLREATGDYLVLLNNDTFVTRGWVRDLIRPLTLDPAVGLVSPLTNNVGNEQKVAVNYSDMEEMADASRAIVRLRPRQRFKTHCVAFFCVAMRRDVFEQIGFLDESYGLGFFEDDDYCKRVIEAGYEIQIVDDAFVHHHLSASFAQLGDKKKQELMERNKAIYEARWGPWKPHSFRDAPGFG